MHMPAVSLQTERTAESRVLPALENASLPAAVVAAAAVAVRFDHVCFAFDEQVVLEDLSFALERGSMTVLLGASGAGKSIVLKLILGLLAPDAGHIFVNGQAVDRMGERDLMRVRADIGMMFQENALFDSSDRCPERRLPIVGGNAPACRGGTPPRRGSARADRPPGLPRRAAGAICRADSGAASRSPARLRHARTSCCWTIRHPDSIRLPPPP